MYWRVVDAEAALHFKRILDIQLQLVIGAEIEIEDISAPVAGEGNDPIRPTVGVVVFLAVRFPPMASIVTSFEERMLTLL